MTELLSVGGKQVRIDVYEPTSSASGLSPAIILLHGSGGNLEWWLDRISPPLKAAGIALFAPHYFDGSGTDHPDYKTIIDGVHFPMWLETVQATLHKVRTRPGIDPSRVALVGVSLGGFLALALAAKLSASPEADEHHAIRCIVDLAGGLAEPYASVATKDFPTTLVVHGEEDRVVSIEDAHKLIARLTELNVEHETLLLPGEGHWFSDGIQLPLFLRLAQFLRKNLGV
ncbi:MAG: alpha/beta fold hydrolase [Acidobacteriaceae bacterium]|nr:alpha/beta fold hydrolase [Acidobacteriaceae bacterium]